LASDSTEGATPLGTRIADLIRAGVPIGIDQFMKLALGDPELGYYRTRDPLGARGDFITAPEISQIFGETIGIWCADQWQRLGAPDPIRLVELGPGRGTLAADLLRALAVLPAARAAVRLHLVETSPVLRRVQAVTLRSRHPDIEPSWHDCLESVPSGPFLLVANEFFDALPIRQWQRSGGRWRERLVGLDDTGRLDFTLGPVAEPPLLAPPAADGAIFETAEPAWQLGHAIGCRLAQANGAALIIDYGHAPTSIGETLQAMRAHRPVPVLAAPGDSDLTAHVDFAALGHAIESAGGRCWGPIAQARFLGANGAGIRIATLTTGKSDEAASAIRTAAHRLLDPTGMGVFFKVLAVTSIGSPAPSGF
jgi:NADH dehydrogenase [ubiquinone] 1 alpha subcomplex assembly factor 7